MPALFTLLKLISPFHSETSIHFAFSTTPVKFTLEQAIEFIDDDELVEVTPESIRIRKKLLTENDRKRANRTTTSTSTH